MQMAHRHHCIRWSLDSWTCWWFLRVSPLSDAQWCSVQDHSLIFTLWAPWILTRALIPVSQFCSDSTVSQWVVSWPAQTAMAAEGMPTGPYWPCTKSVQLCETQCFGYRSHCSNCWFDPTLFYWIFLQQSVRHECQNFMFQLHRKKVQQSGSWHRKRVHAVLSWAHRDHRHVFFHLPVNSLVMLKYVKT